MKMINKTYNKEIFQINLNFKNMKMKINKNLICINPK